ncbi:hypothetical protein BJX66DRAFT_350479 [Aspergillus keveii]|uniref:Integral membrane protein n=1 Tax=Aspergillus keveii TaxID=714993 RepID=A0ABR4G8W0_9EURO
MEAFSKPDTTTECSALPRTNTIPIKTEYMHMLLDLDYIPWYYNVISSITNWVLLAGYLVIPGTFTSLQKSDLLNDDMSTNETGQAIVASIQNPPILAIACAFLVMGLTGMVWLFWKRRDNYIWLINRLLAGLLTTLVNIYTAKNGDWSIMAVLTTIITGLTFSVSVAFTTLFKFVKLERLRREHDLEIKAGFCQVSY